MALLNSTNPTKLRLGASGSLEGRTYQVVGRVVLTTADGYKWQEYNLRDSSGAEATLVFESGDWKLFQLFEPAEPMSVAEAERVRADETVTIEGRSVTVTYVGNSRVVHIEGQAPEGVELNDRARYFNAEPAEGGMIVVSWTGAEMEFYRGHNLRDRVVAQAFNLPRPHWIIRAVDGFRQMNLGLHEVAFWGIFIVFILIGILPDRDPTFTESTPKQAAPAVRLAEKAAGRIDGHTYTVVARALVEVARPGLKFERYEYAVVDEAGRPALLVQELDNTPDDWALLVPGYYGKEVSPYDLARLTPGYAKSADGKDSAIVYVFQSRLAGMEGTPPPERWPAGLQYGFMGRIGDQWVLTRWTEKQVWLDMGRRYTSRDIAAAFQQSDLRVQ